MIINTWQLNQYGCGVIDKVVNVTADDLDLVFLKNSLIGMLTVKFYTFRGRMKTYYRGVKRTEPRTVWQNVTGRS